MTERASAKRIAALESEVGFDPAPAPAPVLELEALPESEFTVRIDGEYLVVSPPEGRSFSIRPKDSIDFTLCDIHGKHAGRLHMKLVDARG